MINGNKKGKRGELEARDKVREHGYEARRGQQFSGGDDSPDVVHSIPGVHLEVKRVEAGNLYNWLDQAINDAGAGKVPVVMHKRNRKEWVAIMRFDDMMNLLLARSP